VPKGLRRIPKTERRVHGLGGKTSNETAGLVIFTILFFSFQLLSARFVVCLKKLITFHLST